MYCWLSNTTRLLCILYIMARRMFSQQMAVTLLVLVTIVVGPSLYILSSSNAATSGSVVTTWSPGHPPHKIVVASAIRNLGRAKLTVKDVEIDPLTKAKSSDHEQKSLVTSGVTRKTGYTSNENLNKVKSNGESKRKDRNKDDGKGQSTDNFKVDSNIKSRNTSLPKSELNYTVTYRQVKAFNYSRLFSYDDRGNCLDMACKWPKMPGATKELVKWAPEIFAKVPVHFLDNFKNPCWVRDEVELSCLPYFYVIGMYKCGTTDIWDKIVAHPDVVKVPKEPHWWGPRRHGFTGTPIHRTEVLRVREVTGGKDDSSLEWYLNLYKSTGVPDIIHNKVTTREGKAYHPKVFGDSSISTAYTIGFDWTKTYPNASEPLFTTADLIRAAQPNAKIIVMIRDPTERANSWYWYSQRKPFISSETWHNFVVKNIGCLQECVKKHNVRYCAYAADCPYKLIPELQVGIYHVYLRDWMNAFSRDGVLVIRLEDWQADPLSVYRKIIKFLDLRQLSDEEESKIIYRPSKNVNKREHDDMLPQTKTILDNFYRPYNKELALLMNDDKFLYPPR